MRRYVVLVLVIAIVLLMGAVAAPATPEGVVVKDNGVQVIGGDVLAPASMPAGAVAYTADLLLGGG